LSDRYREHREDHEEEKEPKEKQLERREQPKYHEQEQKVGGDPDWEKKCMDALDKVESKAEGTAKQEAEDDGWEKRFNKALDELDRQAKDMRGKKSNALESADDDEFSDWGEKCSRALDGVEGEAKRDESEGPDKDERDEARDKLHDEFIDDIEKKLNKEGDEPQVDETAKQLSADKSPHNEIHTGEAPSSESKDSTVSSLVMERPSEEEKESKKDEPEAEPENRIEDKREKLHSKESEAAEHESEKEKKKEHEHDGPHQENGETKEPESVEQTKKRQKLEHPPSEKTENETPEKVEGKEETRCQKQESEVKKGIENCAENNSQPETKEHSEKTTKEKEMEHSEAENKSKSQQTETSEEYEYQKEEHSNVGEIDKLAEPKEHSEEKSRDIEGHQETLNEKEFQKETESQSQESKTDREVPSKSLEIQNEESKHKEREVEHTSEKEAPKSTFSEERKKREIKEISDEDEEFKELLERHHESISNRGKRIEYEFTKDFPSIKDEKITNAEELWGFIKRYHPSLMQRNDFQRLFQYAEIYLGLITDFHEYDIINSSDISRVSEKTGLSKTTIREWLTTDSMPRLFYLLLTRESLEASYQKRIPDFQEYLTKMGRLCNGLDSIDSLFKRIDTLYINEEIGTSQKNKEQAEEFFKIVQAIKEGAKSYGQIEEMTGIKEERVLRRISSPFIPRFVGMVSCIPEEPPSSGKKWLPLRITGSRMKDFIQVPERINEPEEILDVLIQIRNLTSSVEKKDSNPEFSDFAGISNFMYFLGLTISDGNFDSSKKIVSSSERVKLKLSKKYGWSETAGSAYCQTLNELGFNTVKGKDAYGTLSDIPLHVWWSEKSPFFVWVRQELLGLRESRNKNENRVQPNWVLNAPRSWRISMLQGIADGDGFATTKGLYAAIATYTNQEFVGILLKSLDIDSYSTEIAVGIRGIDDIAKAAKLPMFRFAEGRQSRLEKLVPMLESMDWSRISEDEEAFILELHRQGMKVGEITEKLWEKYGRVHRRNTIYNIIERNV
jgi:hypothetical protein